MRLPLAGSDGAELSECRTYRYLLWRRVSSGDRSLCVIGINPSTADEDSPDPTSTRVIGFARSWGFDFVWMVNLYAYRHKDPRVLRQVEDPVGPGWRQSFLTATSSADLVLAAWGADPMARARAPEVLELLAAEGVELHVLGLNKDGSPVHPLYQPASLEPTPWTP